MDDEARNTDTGYDYDSEPVKYCKRCYSLKIQYEEAIDSEYCGNCGCSDIAEAPIGEWERLYENRYHKKFVTEKLNPLNTPIFKSSCRELKKMLFKRRDWREIIRKVCPRISVYMNKEDAILMLFDKLIKENRIEDLKYALLKHKN